MGFAAFLAWTVLAGGLFAWRVHETGRAAHDEAMEDARRLLTLETAFRDWRDRHGPAGGIPFPTETGTRYGVSVRATGPAPLAPANRPDDWETLALARLAAGEREVRGRVRQEGASFLRLMHPVLAEPACLACHAYKAGELAGGIAIAVPLDGRWEAVTRQSRTMVAVALGIWLTVSGLIGLATFVMARRTLSGHRVAPGLHETGEMFRRLAEAAPGDSTGGERLRQSEARLAEAQRIARLGNWTWDRGRGEFLCSEEVFRVLGRDPARDATSRDGFLAAFVPEDRALLTRAEAAALAGKGQISLDLRVLHPDGTRRWVHVEGLAPPDEDRLDGTVQDITERKEREEAMERAAQELARANIQLERFAHVAAHDLQEPLRNIVSYSQLLTKRYSEALTGDGRDYLAMVIGAATRMRILVSDLMTYSRLDSRAQPFRRVDMAEAVGAAEAGLHEAIADTGAQIVLGPLPAINGDEMQMAMVFQHLIGNAIKFHREGVTPRVEIDARLEGKDWLFSVKDNGIGMEPEYHERIFEVFKRLHPPSEYPGTGIGLAIARRVVERHGGRIWVESEPGCGSTFHFTIPVRS
jgi:signal transduction histidine kinase